MEVESESRLSKIEWNRRKKYKTSYVMKITVVKISKRKNLVPCEF